MDREKVIILGSGLILQCPYLISIVVAIWYSHNLPIYSILGFWMWMAFPVITASLFTMWMSYFIKERKTLFILAFLLANILFIVENIIVPVKYYFPKALLLPVIYCVMCLVGARFLPLLGAEWRELADKYPLKIPKKERLKVLREFVHIFYWRGFVGGCIGLVLIEILFLVILLIGPSGFGVGILEYPITFPSYEEFESTVSGRFFVEDPSQAGLRAIYYERRLVSSLLQRASTLTMMQDLGLGWQPGVELSYDQVVLVPSDSSEYSRLDEIHNEYELPMLLETPTSFVEILFINAFPRESAYLDCESVGSVTICQKTDLYYEVEYQGGIPEPLNTTKKEGDKIYEEVEEYFETERLEIEKEKDERILYTRCGDSSLILFSKISPEPSEEYLVNLIKTVKC